MPIAVGLTQADLNKLKCSTPGCTCSDEPMIFRSRCHIHAPTWSWYDKEDGTMTVICSECEKVIVVVQVAEGDA